MSTAGDLPRPQRKRFYASVSMEQGSPGRHRICLDGKPLRTPGKAEFAVPTAALARAIAAEWEAQGDHIDPLSMPLTRLANTAIDGVVARAADVRDDVVRYADSDLVCYRAEGPEELRQLQAQAWDPVLAWARGTLGVPLATCAGLMPTPQPAAARAAIARAVAAYDGFALAALHVLTTLTGSVLVALAHAQGRLTAEAAWSAAHVDEDWQIGRWGEDVEARARRERRWAEMHAASRMLALLAAQS